MTNLQHDAQNTPQASPRFRVPKLMPESLLAVIFLSFLGTAGVFYANILAALVSGLVEGLKYTQETAGYVAAANVYGAAFGAFAAVFAVKRVAWKPAAFCSLLALMAIDLVSTQITLSDILIPVRFGHGLVGGFLVGVAFSVFARTTSPDRTFGMLLVTQAGIGGTGLMVLPKLVPVYGTSVLFLALFGFSAVTLFMLPFLSDYPVKNPATDKTHEGAQNRPEESANGSKLMLGPLLLALLGIFIFQASNMGLAAYMIELGKSFNMATDVVSTHIGVAHWVAVLGALFVYLVGTKYGRVKPLIIGFVFTLVGMSILHLSGMAPWFLVGNIIVSTTWAFLIPYLLGMCAKFDAAGQMATLSGFCSKMGLASGPMVAAVVVGKGNYDLILNMAIIGIALSALIVLMPARLLDKT
ncbi:MAG: MFS transporter [Kordiimonadaceae bacterium]|nr:MFS transporter [Kordiimonadaceae bacterium]